MSFGMFGAIFLLAQYFQTVQGYSPLQSGLRFLPWTALPMIVAPIAGAKSDKIGGYRLLGIGLALQAAGLAWIAAVATPTTPYLELVGPFVLAGVGMAHFFAPVANVVLSTVRPEEEGQASGANNAIRELGGVFGVAILAALFTTYGGYGTGQHFVNGLRPAVFIGAAIVAVGALLAFAIGKRSPHVTKIRKREQLPAETAATEASA
jgi:MFS family permease